MKKKIENYLGKRETCIKCNRKVKRRYKYIETSRPLEKFAIDINGMKTEGHYKTIVIDYFTRHVFTKVIENKRAETILEDVQEWLKGNKPETIITDNGNEFVKDKFSKMFIKNKIEHHKVSVEANNPNGIVESAIKTIREGIKKALGNTLEQKVRIAKIAYNRPYHVVIKMTP